MIKILIAPNFEQDDENDQPKDVMELELVGHKAIVRTVCFNPVDPTILLSGGLLESNVKVWDTESGSNIANLLGHQGDIYSIKMSYDGSFAVSVGTDKTIKIWDVRCRQFVDYIDATGLSEMNEIFSIEHF